MIFKNYKLVLLFCYIPAFLTITFIWLQPRSELKLCAKIWNIINHIIYQLLPGIRWLLSKGKRQEAKRILIKAANLNNTRLPETILSKLDDENLQLKSDEDEKVDENQRQIQSRKTIILQLLLMSYLWFSTIFVYYGLNINSVYLEFWNKYVNYIVSLITRLNYPPSDHKNQFPLSKCVCSFRPSSPLSCLRISSPTQ